MLEVRDLHVKFHSRQRQAVGGVSFSIADGEILGLVGESGSGKSVTALTVAGLLDREKAECSASVLLDGVDLLKLPEPELRQLRGKRIGVVFQEPQTCMDPLMKVGRQVEGFAHPDVPLAERRALNPNILLWPISASARNKNTKLTQTEGWN